MFYGYPGPCMPVACAPVGGFGGGIGCCFAFILIFFIIFFVCCCGGCGFGGCC